MDPSNPARPSEPPAATPAGERASPWSRRQAIAGAGTVGALAAVAAVLPGIEGEAAAPGAAGAAAGEADGRYQLSPHVLRYYETTRI